MYADVKGKEMGIIYAMEPQGSIFFFLLERPVSTLGGVEARLFPG